MEPRGPSTNSKHTRSLVPVPRDTSDLVNFFTFLLSTQQKRESEIEIYEKLNTFGFSTLLLKRWC